MKNWSNNKLRFIYIITHLIYLILILVAPIVIIILNYNLTATYKLSGFGMILMLIFGVVGLLNLKKIISKFPKAKIKFTLDFCYSSLYLILIISVLHMFTLNFDLAYKTILECIGFIFAAIIIDNFGISFLDLEYSYRRQAQNNAEIERRVLHVK